MTRHPAGRAGVRPRDTRPRTPQLGGAVGVLTRPDDTRPPPRPTQPDPPNPRDPDLPRDPDRPLQPPDGDR